MSPTPTPSVFRKVLFYPNSAPPWRPVQRTLFHQTLHTIEGYFGIFWTAPPLPNQLLFLKICILQSSQLPTHIVAFEFSAPFPSSAPPCRVRNNGFSPKSAPLAYRNSPLFKPHPHSRAFFQVSILYFPQLSPPPSSLSNLSSFCPHSAPHSLL